MADYPIVESIVGSDYEYNSTYITCIICPPVIVQGNIVIGTKYGVYVNLHLTADVFLFHHINIGGYMVFGSIVGSDYYV